MVAGIDSDGTCRETYERNNHNTSLDGRPPTFLNHDMFPVSDDYPDGQQERVYERLRDLVPHYRAAARGVPLMFTVCAPCQAFTRFTQRHMTVARAASRDRDRHLLSQTLGFVDEFEPELVLCENVTGVRRGPSHDVWRQFIAALHDREYDVDDRDICASDFGVPQYRRRSFLMGVRGNSSVVGAPRVIVPTSCDSPTVSVKAAIGDLPPLHAGEGHAGIPNHVCRDLSDINRRRLEYLMPGDSNLRLDDAPSGDLALACHRRLEGVRKRGFGDVYTRMRPDKPAPTITTRFVSVSNGRFGHFDPKQVRGLSVREGALLQSFPLDYQFYGSGVEASAKMIGNAVPPKLAAKMASHLLATWSGSVRQGRGP